MINPGFSVLLSPRARRDVVHILRYTGEQWGPSQFEAYSNNIDVAIQRISRNPEIGALRNDLDQPYRTFPVGAHVIVYRIRENQIRIIRILHQRMDPADRY